MSSINTPNDDDRFSAGDWLYWTCEYDKAREHFRTMLKRPPTNVPGLIRCYKSLAAVEVELNNYDEAIYLYNKQLDLLSTSDSSSATKVDIMSCYVSIGKTYWLKSDYEEAIQYHQRVLDLARSVTASFSHISVVHKNLANIYTKMKKFELALEHFQHALELDGQHLREDHPQFGQTYANMAAMYQLEENYEQALIYFEKARETCLQNLSPSHYFIERIDKAICSLVQRNIMIIWLDEWIGRDENCRELKKEFRQLTNSFRMVDSVESCRQLLPFVKDRKVFFIVQGKHAEEIVPDIERTFSPTMKPVVYIFCLHMTCLNDWAQEQQCIMEGGMFDHEKDLLDRLAHDLNQYVRQQPAKYKSSCLPEAVSKFLAELMALSERCFHEREATTSPNRHNKTAPISAQ